MRIIGGTHRGRKLAEFKGEEIRPTSDRVKESLFNILSNRVAGARVLDLFCGSGNIGLECISRGAAHVCFNDVSKDSLQVLKKNLALIGEEAKCKITCYDYLTCLNTADGGFDLIYIDPPYRFDYGVPALKVIAERKLLNDGGVVVYERDREFEGEVAPFKICDKRKYGKAYLTFFNCKELFL